MGCACYTATMTRELSDSFRADFSLAEAIPFFAGFELVDNGLFSATLERTCEIVADLVAFSAMDGMFLTSEGYTILVKI